MDGLPTREREKGRWGEKVPFSPSPFLHLKSSVVLDLHAHVHRADLDRVADEELTRLTRINAFTIDEGAVGAVEVFNREVAGRVIVDQKGMLARAPDAVFGFLEGQVDIDRLLVGAADVIVA